MIYTLFNVHVDSQNIDMNIYNSTKNVNLNSIISYVKDGEVHHFMDDYEKK